MKRIAIFLPLLLIALLLQAQDKKPFKVYVFFAEECPISIYMTKPLQEVARNYWKNSHFYAVFPQQKSNFESALEFKEQYQLEQFEILMDSDQSITRSLQGTVTPEVVITDLEEQVLYRGRISNAYAAPGKMKHGKRTNELLHIMEKLSQGQSIASPWKSAIGCYITFKPQ